MVKGRAFERYSSEMQPIACPNLSEDGSLGDSWDTSLGQGLYSLLRVSSSREDQEGRAEPGMVGG